MYLRYIRVASNTKTCSHVNIHVQGTTVLNKIYELSLDRRFFNVRMCTQVIICYLFIFILYYFILTE